MFSKLFRLISENPGVTLAIIAGLAVLTFALVDSQWWGEMGLGVFIGVAITLIIVLSILWIVDESTSSEIKPWLPAWLLVIVPTGTALILRGFSRNSFHITLPQLRMPALPSVQSILLLVAAGGLVVLLLALVRSLSRGEAVSVESHWGGLGGGIVGWRLSAPLVYLLGIVVLLLICSAVAWRSFQLPLSNQQQSSTSSTSSGSSNH